MKGNAGKTAGICLVAAVGLMLAFAAWFWVKSRNQPIQKETRFLMDTICTIYIPGPKSMLPVISKALDRAEAIDKKFNALNRESPIFAFNQQNRPIKDPEIISVVRKALGVCRQSRGAFDITIYPLIRLWGFFNKKGPHLPHDSEIKAALSHIGYQYLDLQDGVLRKRRPDIKIDLGGIAKGYAVDEAVGILKQEGIQSALVDFGGDIYALGNFRNRPWNVGIRNPRGKGEVGGFELSDLSTATSGDYERFFEEKGVRYHHILDPKTGYPARGLRSATVISSDATLADAWSTAAFVLGRKTFLPLVDKTPGLRGAVLIALDGTITTSSNLKGHFKKNGKGK